MRKQPGVSAGPRSNSLSIKESTHQERRCRRVLKQWAPQGAHSNTTGEKHMTTQLNRVLVRAGARELSRDEIEKVPGGVGTTTKCSFVPPSFKDGDPGEC